MRPVLIDERDGPCELCASRKRQFCAECGIAIPVYENMGGNGFQSVMPDHFHLRPIEGLSGREAKFKELCLACYQAHRKQVYPNERLSGSVAA